MFATRSLTVSSPTTHYLQERLLVQVRSFLLLYLQASRAQGIATRPSWPQEIARIF